jgi:hypothetical protein
MKTEQFIWTDSAGWDPTAPGGLGNAAHLVIIFCDASMHPPISRLNEIADLYPNAKILGCSSSGEIIGGQVLDHSLVLTAISFEHTRVMEHSVRLSDVQSSYEAGERLARSLDPQGLVHAFVLGDGFQGSGDPFVQGIAKHLPSNVTVTGGLAGTRANFTDSFCISNGYAEAKSASIIGLYGDRLSVGYAALSGWRPFGPHRLVTKSSGRELFEIDGRSALQLYRDYLDEHAPGLPQTALRFPLEVRREDEESGVVRAILSVDDERQSMTLAGEVPVGYYARLMMGSHDAIIDGAAGAAYSSYTGIGPGGAELALITSCVARKFALRQRTEEEIEAVRDVYGADTCIAGFYSYGEIGPRTKTSECRLHNQTMTVTAFREE